MTDTSVMQDRIGQLCGQFKLPTMGAQSVTRFNRRWTRRRSAHTPGGTGTGSRGSPPPTHQPAAPRIQAALGQDLGNLRA